MSSQLRLPRQQIEEALRKSEETVTTDITDLKRAEEIRWRYAAIVESSEDAIIAKNLEGVIVAWNAAAQRMFGYTEQEAIGQSIMIIIPPELRDEEHDNLRRLAAGERIHIHETVRATKAGERIDVSLTISPVRDAAGKIVGCSKIARDITESKLSEQRLAREVAGATTLQSISARLMSESTAESLYAQILDAAMQLMAADAASVQILAPDRASLTLLAWRNFHPDSAAFWQRVTVGAGSTCSKALSDMERILVADIEACDFMVGTQDQQEYRRSGLRAVQSTPLRSGSGSPLGMLSTHWRTPHTPTEDDFRFFDVLAQQAADLMERAHAEDALRESEERFRLMTNATPVMIWTTGLDKRCTYVNDAVLEFSRRPIEAELGYGWVERVHPDDSARCLDTYTQAFDRRLPFKMEYRYGRHDGKYRSILASGAPMLLPDGSFAGYVGSAIDITDQKLAMEALSNLSRSLMEAQENERAWIARDLHDDLGQSVAVLAVQLNTCARVLPSGTPEHVSVQKACDQVAALARDLRAIARRLHSAKLEFLGLTPAVASLCHELSEQFQVEIDFSHSGIPQNLSKDIALCLFRVLQGALHNALKYAGVRHFRVTLRGTPTEIQLEVSDTGIGFDPELAIGGEGLGLISMRERLRLVKGEFFIESRPGHGTTIRARVGLRPVESAEIAQS